uniref:Oxidoreductase, short-chain dehydrogenase/reductase family n=1 Tax=Chlorobium chlorochromatii (strain CaD3) TaxID=340177 RepID=Q3ATL9_CHLCH
MTKRSYLHSISYSGYSYAIPSGLKTREKTIGNMQQRHNSLGIVITGGSKGLGFALAARFLAEGDRVVLCARNGERLEAALAALRQQVPTGEVYGIACDVADTAAPPLLAQFAVAKLGNIDRWINNAGTAGLQKRPLWQLAGSDIAETCTTNLAGTMAMCAEAVRVMQRQPSAPQACYHIFNMGFSAVGASFSRSAVPHKASKRGVAEITHFLARELHEAAIRSIGVHELSPGLVLTDLLLRDAPADTRRFLQVVAQTPEAVAAVLAPKIRKVRGLNRTVRYEPLVAMVFRMVAGLPRLLRSASATS